MRDSAADSLGSIARLGRAPGVHLLAAAQRPDARVLSGKLEQQPALPAAARHAVAVGGADGPRRR